MIPKDKNQHYVCKNCLNLKEKLIKKQDIDKIDRKTIREAIETHTTESLALTFPINLPAYNRIKKSGYCRIIYCSADMLNRALYIYRNNFNIDSIALDKKRPCPKWQ